ncbi:MAG: hypothetical protein LC749_12695 [Actinobacteria bacterium]|nr:hypothetical protein [Actinomycetota bacterium]
MGHWLLLRAVREFDDTAEDLRAAFDNLRAVGGEEPHQRRALKTVLNELYRVQEYRCGCNKVNKQPYFAHAESCDPGKITLGIVFLRGVLTQHVIKQVRPTKQPLYPSEDLSPSDDLSSGSNFVWISGTDLLEVHTPEPQFANVQPYYNSHVGGQLMLPTIRQAIDFLLTDPVVGKLEYV